jgi:hypothetical protein
MGGVIVLPGWTSSRIRNGYVLALGIVAAVVSGCSDTRLTFTQSGKGGPHTYLLTARQCTWANTAEGGACVALTYQWDTHAGQFILEGVRSRYLRVVIRLPEPLVGPGSGTEVELKPGMVQAYDDYTDRGMCFSGGAGRVNVLCGKANKLTGSFEVQCRGFLPGREQTSRFSDDYTLRARFEAQPDAASTLRTVDDVAWFFASPERRPVR